MSHWPGGALIVGGVLLVAARYHRHTFGPWAKNPRLVRWLYWCSSLIGAALATAAMIPYSGVAALAIGFCALFTTVLHGPIGPWQRRQWDPSRNKRIS